MKHAPKQSLLLLLAVFLTLSMNASAGNTWYVNGVTGNDSNSCTAATAACKTIGHAIILSASGDAINIAAATYTENLSLTFSLAITGASSRTTIIDGGKSDTVITINGASAQVSLSQLTIRNGYGKVHGGGGVYNLGILTITNSTLSGNSSDDLGNIQGGSGGGIYNGGTLNVISSTITGNSITRYNLGVSPYGAGIYNVCKLTVTNSTLSSNQAAAYWPAGVPYGGGIANEGGTALISNSTLSNNSVVIHTPFGKAGTYGGGIDNSGSATATLQNTIVSNNSPATGNCHGTLSSLGFNMSNDASCNLNGAGDQKSINPQLGALQNNGGPTNTMALAAGSPALNAGNPNGCTDANDKRLATDQRGDARPNPGACDIGAYNH
jgi:hypothetical protein